MLIVVFILNRNKTSFKIQTKPLQEKFKNNGFFHFLSFYNVHVLNDTKENYEMKPISNYIFTSKTKTSNQNHSISTPY
jgi:hypothetical protein